VAAKRQYFGTEPETVGSAAVAEVPLVVIVTPVLTMVSVSMLILR
jgi:hypothetical protein